MRGRSWYHDVAASWFFCPNTPEEWQQLVGISVHQLGIDGGLAPTILNRTQILDAIVKHRLVEPRKPALARRTIGRCGNVYRQ